MYEMKKENIVRLVFSDSTFYLKEPESHLIKNTNSLSISTDVSFYDTISFPVN